MAASPCMVSCFAIAVDRTRPASPGFRSFEPARKSAARLSRAGRRCGCFGGDTRATRAVASLGGTHSTRSTLRLFAVHFTAARSRLLLSPGRRQSGGSAGPAHPAGSQAERAGRTANRTEIARASQSERGERIVAAADRVRLQSDRRSAVLRLRKSPTPAWCAFSAGTRPATVEPLIARCPASFLRLLLESALSELVQLVQLFADAEGRLNLI